MMPTPSTPCPYVSGTITVPADKPVGVLELIHQQLNPNAPGTGVEFRISADPSNSGPVFLGQIYDAIPLSCTNYGASLSPGGPERIYRASFPGTGTPQGMMQVYSEAGGAKLHVEIIT